jgi:hypothetical protein
MIGNSRGLPKMEPVPLTPACRPATTDHSNVANEIIVWNKMTYMTGLTCMIISILPMPK